MSWNRYRFEANLDDYRPVIWPPVGPYWCSGYGNDHSIVVAYAHSLDEIMKQWPEAKNIDFEERTEITFTDRFAKPSWWDDKTNSVVK